MFKNRLFLFAVIISVLLHILFFSIFYLLDIQKPKSKPVERNRIYLYLPEKKFTDKTKKTEKKLKLPSVTKKDKNFFLKKKESNKTIRRKKKLIKKSIEKISKPVKKTDSFKKKTLDKKEKIDIKVEKKVKKKKKEEIKKENLPTNNNEKKELTNSNLNNTYTKELSLKDLLGKSDYLELGKKEVVKEELNRDEDVESYLRELSIYLNKLARRKDLYPPMAKRLKLEGSLVVRFKINPDGSVDEKSIKIIISSGYNILDEGAIKIIKKYVPLFAKKYNKYPPKENFQVELPITFEIIGW